MITVFISEAHRYTFRPFLDTWPNRAAASIRLVPYEYMYRIRSIRPGVFVFSDIERLKPWSQQAAKTLCQEIQIHWGDGCILNHPARAMRRRDLLNALWEAGTNVFRFFTLPAPTDSMRFPVFIRRADDHNGTLTDLLEGPEAFEAGYRSLLKKGIRSEELIGVEFCETCGADKLFRKYSSFRVGDRIVPGHIIFATDWVTKDSPPEPLRDEERDYLLNNPHEQELMRIFRLANIEYGRIDYGLKDGRIQVWEINTNPVVIQSYEQYATDKLPMKQGLVDQLAQAFSALMETSCQESKPVAVNPGGVNLFRLDLQLVRLCHPIHLT